MAVSMGPNGITLGTSTKSDWADVGGGVPTDSNLGVGCFTVGKPSGQWNRSATSSISTMGYVNGSFAFSGVGGTWRNTGQTINNSGYTTGQRIS